MHWDVCGMRRYEYAIVIVVHANEVDSMQHNTILCKDVTYKATYYSMARHSTGLCTSHNIQCSVLYQWTATQHNPVCCDAMRNVIWSWIWYGMYVRVIDILHRGSTDQGMSSLVQGDNYQGDHMCAYIQIWACYTKLLYHAGTLPCHTISYHTIQYHSIRTTLCNTTMISLTSLH